MTEAPIELTQEQLAELGIAVKDTSRFKPGLGSGR